MCIIKRNIVCYYTLCEAKMPTRWFTDPRTRCRCKEPAELSDEKDWDKELRQCYVHEPGWQMCCYSPYHRLCYKNLKEGKLPKNPQRGRYEDELYEKK